MTRTFLFAAVVAAALPLTSASAQTYTYQTFLTSLVGINDNGEIVGFSAPTSECFILQGGPLHKQMQQPIPPNVIVTICGNGINKSGAIAGSYVIRVGFPGPPTSTLGYVLTGTSYAAFEAPNSTDTYGYDISNKGVVSGYYIEFMSGVQHGFLYDGTKFTTHDVPGGINNVITGVNSYGAYIIHGKVNGVAVSYLVPRIGKATLLAFPGAISTAANKLTDNGLTALTYRDASGQKHAGIYSNRTKTYTAIPDPAGAVSVEAIGLNRYGQVVGSYFDASNNQFGFLATPSK